MKILFMLLVILMLSISCTQYTATIFEKINGSLILLNVPNITMYENNRQVFVKNESVQLVIELEYIINGNALIVYDTIVPNEELFIYSWPERIYYDVIISIGNVEFY